MKTNRFTPMSLLSRLATVLASAAIAWNSFAAPNVPPTAGPATAAQFNLKNGYVDVPDGVWFGNAFTVEGWVYLKSYANWSRFFDFGNGPGNENIFGALTQGTSGFPVFGIYQGSGGVNSEIVALNQIPLNTWTHVAFVREANATGRIFIDGVQSQTGSMMPPNSVTRTGNYFGHSNWAADENVDGSFADFRIWNIARTAAEINATKGIALSPLTSGLILNYRFNEGWGTTVKDLATEDGTQNGTLVNDTVLIGADAVLGQAIQMDIATDQKVRIDNFGQLLNFTAITIESWVRTDANVNQSVFFLSGTGSQRINAHVPWPDGRIYWDYGDIGDSGEPGRLSYVPTVSPVGRWDHYAFVSTETPWNMRVYRNGVLEGNRDSHSYLNPLTGTFEIRPGGARANFRVWKSGRSQSQIVDNMYLRVPTDTTDLLLNLLFSETSGTTAADSAPLSGAQNGTLLNSPVLYATRNAALAAKYTTATQVKEGSPQLVYLPAADYDSTLTYSSVTATNGTLAPLTGGNFLYTPNAGYSGNDLVRFAVTDGVSTRSNSVPVTVTAVNDPPVVGSATALEFDGVNDYVALTNLGLIQNQFTVEAWVRPDSTTSILSVMGSRAPSEASFDFKFMNGNKIHGDIGTGTGWITTSADANFNYTAGTWYHVAYVVTTIDYKIYVDGNLVGSGPLNYLSGTPVLCNDTHKLVLGSYALGGTEQFKGRIGNVRIWNTAKSQIELQYYKHANLTDGMPGLVAQYRMNEGSGTTLNDVATTVGGAQNGTLVNGPTWQIADGPERSLTLDGSTQHAQVLDNAAVSITGPITLEAWIRPAAIGTHMGIIEKYGANDGGYALRLDPFGKIAMSVIDKTGASSSAVGNTVLKPNYWTHVAGRWDGSLLQVYVNGVLDATVVTARNPKDGTTPLYIGAVGDSPNLKFSGRIGDVRVWNVARTAAEISAFRGGVAANSPGLVINYLFTEGSGTTLTDVATLSGAQNASLVGNPTWPPAETLLAHKQAITYYEDQSIDFTLPAFDQEGGMSYTSASASSGTIAYQAGNAFLYTPAPNFNGPVTITYTVSDGNTSMTAKVYLQGTPQEDGPFIAAIPNQSIGEGSPTTSLGISLNDGDPELIEPLTLSATSSDTDLIRNPAVIYTSPNETAQLTYKPRPGKNGTATITVVATEPGSGYSFTRTFDITVNSVDDWPNAGPATAAQFNGANYASIPGFGAQLPTDELTVEFWQFVNGVTTQSTAVLMPDDTGNRFLIHSPWNTGAVIWDMGNSLVEGRLLYTPPVSIVGSWQHFAFVASKTGNYMKIFRNGIEEASKAGVSSTFLPNGRELQIGGFAGQLAEFRVWKVARTAEQIAATMHASLRNDDANLVAYYRFNQKPTTTLVDFASAANQAGAQDGVLVPDNSDSDPIWQTNSVNVPAWQTSVPTLKSLQVVKVPDGATTNVYLPAWDPENGTALTWQNVNASTGSVAVVSGGLWAYTAPVGYSGPATITYSVKDTNSVSHVSTASINLNIIVATNNPPTISAVPNTAAEEDSALIEIPFTVSDDQPASALTITPLLLENAALIQSVTVPAGGNFRSVNLVPKPGEIGTVHIRLHVLDAGGKTAQTEFDLRIEPKPAFSVMDLGVLPGKSASFGTAINDQGAVTGYAAETADKESNPIGFFFNGIQNGGVIENNPLSQVAQASLTSPFRPWAINNDYAVAGSGANGGQTAAWLKLIEGPLSNLGALPGGTNAEVRALNHAGMLAGFSIASGKRHAFSYALGDGALTDLGLAPAPFNDQSDAFGLNASNHVVGSVYAADGRRRAMFRKDSAMLPLFSVPNDTNSVAYGINVSDQVVGSATTFVAGDTALSFDGTDDYVVQTNLLTNPGGTPSVAGDAAHTIEAWIRVASLPTNRSWPILLGNLAAGSHHWLVNNTANGSDLQVGLHSRGSGRVPITLGAWMHVASTYAPGTSQLVIYLNGQPLSTNIVGDADLQGIPLKLGFANGQDYFNGSLDEVRVWNTTRTAAQIAENYTKRLNGDEAGLVVYYPFDEGGGTATTTSAANGHLVGQLNGSPTWTVRGGLPAPDLTIGEPTLLFDGASSQVNGPSLPLANNSFTVEFSARRAESSHPDIAISMGTNALNLGLHIGFRPENNFTFAFYGNDLNAQPSASDLAWHHWACSFDSTTKARKIYRDGVLVAQDIATANFQGTGPLIIGRIAYEPTWFKGTIDDVRVWSVVRTPDEIAANRNVRLPGNTPGLLSYYLFDEGGGNTTANRVAGAAAGSLQGAVSWSARDTGSKRAFLYETESGRLTSLGTVGNGDSEARGINDFGQVVGAVTGSTKAAFFYSAGKLNNLNDLLPENEVSEWNLQSANAINRSGAIVGTGEHNGNTHAFIALPATVIGRPVIRPQGAVDRLPQITILKKHLPDDSVINAFYWSDGEKKLYAIRPVTAKIEWFTSYDDIVGTGTNITSNNERVVSVTVNVWPKQPTIHIAGAPVDLQPTVTAAHYTFQNLIYVTNAATVEPSAKVFTSPTPGYTVAFYLKNDGLTVSASQPPYFEVIRTVPYSDKVHTTFNSQDWTIGQEVTEAGHREYDDKNGYILLEKAAYDGSGTDRAYDRGTRLGPILPVNQEKPGGNLTANPDPLIVVWYRTNRIGVAWASAPVQYSLKWPADSVAEKIIIASQLGSGYLDAADYPGKTIYNQPDVSLPGFNPNEEHAYMPADALFALRNDLNGENYSQPFALLKYRNPTTSRWQMRVFKVVAEQDPYFFRYTGTVGKEVQPPLPVNLMPLSSKSYQNPGDSLVGWKDYKGKFYARQAGPEGTHTNLVIRWYYPMQPGFYHPDKSVQVGDSLAWLDRRPTNNLISPNNTVGILGQPIDVTYDIRWDETAVLQVGESLLHSKRGMPDVFNMANARVIFDSLTGPVFGSTNTLARFYDPISARTITKNVVIPPTLRRQNINGKEYFIDLPWFIKIRLSYDPINNWLSFAGYLDENFGVGEPLLLPNVITSRERDRIKALADGDGSWTALVDQLYDLTRNPNQVDIDPFDGLVDKALRLGLTRVQTTNFVPVVGLRKTIITVQGPPIYDPSFPGLVIGYGPPITQIVYLPESNLPANIEEARQLDVRLANDFRIGDFRTADNQAPRSSYNIFIGPTTTIEQGPKVLTAGLGGVAAAQVKPGNALSFNGTSGLVTVTPTNLPALDLTGTPFTIEFWARVNSPTTEQYLLSQPAGSANLGQLRLGFRDGGKFAFDLGSAPASVSIFNTAETYTDTNWHHWAATFDPETKVQSIYHDGVLVESRNNDALNYFGFGTVELGRFGTQYFGGQLDEIRIWKTARTASQIRAQMNKRQLGSGVESKLELLFRCDESAGPIASDALPAGSYVGTLSSGVSLVTSQAPTGIPPRYITIAENNDPLLGGLPVALHVIRVDDGPFLGDLKVLPGDNVFDERLTMRHSSDFGGDPDPTTFQWYYKPIGADFDPTDLPIVSDPNAAFPSDMRGWTVYSGYKPVDGKGVNYITIGEGGESGLITLSDNAFICRYRGYAVNLNSAAAWSGWVGDPSGTPEQPRAALAEGWVKRVIRGLNPFDARTSDFHSAASVTYSSMLIQAGQRYEGPIAFNPAADAINKVGLIEAYTTVLERAKGLSIEGVPEGIDFNPANNALLLAATKISDLYMVLGNEAYADASDPTIGFGIGSNEYGSLASSIFAFQNQLDSLLDEELSLLRGRDDSSAGVAARPVYNRLLWNFTLGEGEVAYQQNYNISDQDSNGFIDERDARILYPQGHGDAWGHYLTAVKEHYELLRHPHFTWIPRSEFVVLGGLTHKVDFLDERKFAVAAAAKARAGAEIVDLTYRLNYVDDPAGQWQGYKDTKSDRAWGVTEWARRAGMGAYFDWLTGNTMLPSVDPNPAHTGIDKIDRQTVSELQEIPAQYAEIQTRLDQADAGLNPLGLAKGVVPFDIDPSLVSGAAGVAGKTHYEQIQERALKAMNNALTVWNEVNKSTEALRRNQDSVEQFTANVNDQERDYKNRLIEIYGYPHAGDIGAGKTYPSGYDGPDLYHYMYVPVPDFDGTTIRDGESAKGYFTKMNLGINNIGDTESGAFGSETKEFFFPADFASDLANGSNALSSSNQVLEVIYPRTTARYALSTPASWGVRRAPGEIQMALSDLIQTEARLRASLKAEDALFADIDSQVDILNARYAFRADEVRLKSDLANVKISFASTLIGLKAGQAIALKIGHSVIRTADATQEGLPKNVGLATDATSFARSAIKFSGAIVENVNSGIAAALDAAGQVIEKIGLPAAEGIVNAKIDGSRFKYEIQVQIAELEKTLHQVAEARIETIRLSEAVNQAGGRYLAALAKGQRLLEERVAYRIRVAARTTENRYQDMTFRVFRNDALQKYRATYDLAQRYVFLAATAYDYESNLLGTDTRGGRAFLTDIIRQRSLGQMLNGLPVVGRAGLGDPLARMSGNFDVLKTQLGFNNPQTETGRFSLRNELFRLRESSAADWRARLRTTQVSNLWEVPEFRRYCRPFAPESAGVQPGLVIRFPTTVTAGKNFFNWPLGGGDSAYDASRFATKIRSVGVWFTGYNGLGLSQTPRVYLVPAGGEVLSSPTPNDFITREWRVVDQALPVPFPIGANRLSDPSWIPVNDSLGGSFAEVRRFSSFRAYHDSGGFNQNEAISDSRLIGRSVWNKDWLLIIPGQTFLANSGQGLDTFINSVSDIKLFFQTYSYSGN